MDRISVVQEYFAAWQSGDVEGLTSVLDEEVTATGPLATVRGARAHAASLVRSAPMFRDIGVDQMLSDDERFVISWFRFELLDGTTVRAANRCEVVNGLIASIEVTFDPRPLLASASPSE